MLLSTSLFNVNFLKFSLVRPLLYSSLAYPFLKEVNSFKPNLVLRCKFTNIDNLNNNRVLGAYCILGVFTKQTPYISRINVFSSFKVEKVSKYSFLAMVSLSSKKIYNFFDFFYTSFISYFLISDFSFHNWDNFSTYVIVIGDIKYNRYIERKSEFFKWKEPLYLIFSSKYYVSLMSFLNFFKLLY